MGRRRDGLLIFRVSEIRVAADERSIPQPGGRTIGRRERRLSRARICVKVKTPISRADTERERADVAQTDGKLRRRTPARFVS